jgi:hypothetical protein
MKTWIKDDVFPGFARETRIVFIVLAVLAALALGAAVADAQTSLTPSQVSTAQAAIDLLPSRVKVVLVDPARDLAPEARAAVAGLDGFTLRTDTERVYINTATELFRRAEASTFYRYALAAVIWHERAHVDGADERGAQRAEEDLWTRFMRDRVVDNDLGLRYLNAMAKRKRDQ